MQERVKDWLLVAGCWLLVAAGINVWAAEKLSEEKSASGGEKGLVGYWNFDEGKGDVAKDSSGNGLHGEINEAKWVKGKVGSALEFNGESSHVDVEHSDLLTPENFTVELWVNPGSLTSSDWGPMILSKYGGNWEGYVLQLTGTDGSARFAICTPEKQAGANAPTAVKIGSWYHLAGTYDGKKTNIYVNGVLKPGGEEGEITHDDAIPLMIGKNSWSDLGYFNGIIDEVKIYNRALSANEIKAHYESAK